MTQNDCQTLTRQQVTKLRLQKLTTKNVKMGADLKALSN